MIEEIKELTSLDGPSGYEYKVRNYLKEKLPKDFDIFIDRIGNLVAKKEGNKPRVLVTAHMDEVGFIVQHITEEGFIKFSPIGGWDDRIVLGMPVKILGNEDVIGVVSTIPPHVLKQEDLNKVIKIEEAFIDTGYDKKELKKLGIDIGSFIVPYSNFIINKNIIMNKAFDDRIGCSILLEVSKIAKDLNYEIIIGATVQEEVGSRGAKVLAYEQDPDIAIVVECTTATDLPNIEESKHVTKLKEGPAITIMDKTFIADRNIVKNIVNIAENKNIKYQFKKPVFGGTDAGAIHISRRGIKTIVISCPARYIHSSYSLADINDIKNTKELILEILKNLELIK